MKNLNRLGASGSACTKAVQCAQVCTPQAFLGGRWKDLESANRNLEMELELERAGRSAAEKQVAALQNDLQLQRNRVEHLQSELANARASEANARRDAEVAEEKQAAGTALVASSLSELERCRLKVEDRSGVIFRCTEDAALQAQEIERLQARCRGLQSARTRVLEVCKDHEAHILRALREVEALRRQVAHKDRELASLKTIAQSASPLQPKRLTSAAKENLQHRGLMRGERLEEPTLEEWLQKRGLLDAAKGLRALGAMTHSDIIFVTQKEIETLNLSSIAQRRLQQEVVRLTHKHWGGSEHSIRYP